LEKKKSVRSICSPRGMKTTEIKQASEVFVNFARIIQNHERLDDNLKKEVTKFSYKYLY